MYLKLKLCTSIQYSAKLMSRFVLEERASVLSNSVMKKPFFNLNGIRNC